tara:strand:+ start:1770 stop:2063 length:294 start_codon:yes stop_codon:yes gene_type:complete
MKITKEQIEQIIREEYKAVKENITAGQGKKQIEAAKQLGYTLAGQPPTAAAVRDALKSRFPEAAEALYKAYEEAQMDADMMYSGDFDDDDLYEKKKK